MLGSYAESDSPGIIASTIGAILVLVAYRVFFREKKPEAAPTR